MRYAEAITKLTQLESTAANKFGKAALKHYREEIEKIASGKDASFSQDELSRIVNDIIPKE